MPVPIAAKAGIIAVSVAVAAAIAVYESPELRRIADDLRRRIAVALHSFGDGIAPPDGEPRFNRPEDAEGFLRSRGMAAEADPGVDADEDARRRQREELMYWNQLHLQKKEEEERRKTAEETATRQRPSRRGSSFDDFLQEDKSAEKGTYVFNTGADAHGLDDGGLVLRHRAVPAGVRGLNASMYANPFSDEHGIELDDHPDMETGVLSPGRDEVMSDIYNATEPEAPVLPPPVALSPRPMSEAAQTRTDGTRLLEPELGSHELDDRSEITDPAQTRTDGTRLLEPELGSHEYVTAGQDDDRHEVYASIQAWAQNSNQTGFYSPLPVSPPAPLSEPELISDGALTPTDSHSLAGSGEDIGNDAISDRSATEGRYYDVISDDGDNAMTPASWTEVGSVVSESDGGAIRHS